MDLGHDHFSSQCSNNYAGTVEFVKAILFVLLAAVVAPTAALAQSSLPVVVHTDHDMYRAGDIIVIYGTVSPVLSNEQIRMKITGNALVEIAQFDVAQDGSYAHTVNTGGPNWRHHGEYTLQVWYGEATQSLLFDFEPGDREAELAVVEVSDGRGGTFDVDYAIRGGSINDMAVDYDNLAIGIEIESDSDGSLILDLPRLYIDAVTMDGDDEDFIVLADGFPAPSIDDRGSDVRRLTVTFPAGTSEIMIIGTNVVPEFGVALAALAAGVAATAVAARTGRLRIGTSA